MTTPETTATGPTVRAPTFEGTSADGHRPADCPCLCCEIRRLQRARDHYRGEAYRLAELLTDASIEGPTP